MSERTMLEAPECSPHLDARRLRDARPRDLLIRFAFGAATSMLSAYVSLSLGPRVGGPLLAFPATLAASLTLISQKDGVDAAREDARGAVLGAIALACFAVVGALLFGRLAGGVVLALASGAWTLVAIGAYFSIWGRTRRGGPTNLSSALDGRLRGTRAMFMLADMRLTSRICAAVGATVALFATFLPWYSYEVVLPAGRVIHVFAVTTTLWGFQTLAPILIVVGAVATLVLVGASYARPAAVVVGVLGLAILVYAVVRCFDVPDLGVLLVSPVGVARVAAVTKLEGGPFVELAGGLLMVVGGVGLALPSDAGAIEARRVAGRREPAIGSMGRTTNPV